MEFQVLFFAMIFMVGLQVSYERKSKKPPQTLSRGWGDDITWVQTYEEGLAKTKASQKPFMVIHHLEDCPHSQALKKAFAADEEIQKMAQEDFIMLNLLFETIDNNLSPDGVYVPRILFIDPSLRVRNDIHGKYGNSLYTYKAEDMDVLKENMKKAKNLVHTEL